MVRQRRHFRSYGFRKVLVNPDMPKSRGGFYGETSRMKYYRINKEIRDLAHDLSSQKPGSLHQSLMVHKLRDKKRELSEVKF